MPLVVATEAEQRARDRVTHAAWGQRLSVDAYAERERRLRAHRWARAAMTAWLWKDDAGAILASCETFRMEGTAGGRAGHAYGVASVYTEPHLRGRGHATAMMRALVARLPSVDSDAFASILFSDVGEAIYGRAGYVARVFPYRVLEAVPGDPATAVDALLTQGDLEAALAVAPWPGGEVGVRPTAPQLDWHLERQRIYDDLMGLAHTEVCGARAGRDLVVWYLDRKTDRLELLLLLAGSEAGASALVEAARRTAAHLGVAEVRHWTSPGDPPLPAALGREVARKSSLPMMAPLWPTARPQSWTFIPRALWV